MPTPAEIDSLNSLLRAYVVHGVGQGESAAVLAKDHKLLMTASEAESFAQELEKAGYLDHIQMWETSTRSDGVVRKKIQLPSGTHFMANEKGKRFLAAGGYRRARLTGWERFERFLKVLGLVSIVASGIAIWRYIAAGDSTEQNPNQAIDPPANGIAADTGTLVIPPVDSTTTQADTISATKKSLPVFSTEVHQYRVDSAGNPVDTTYFLKR